MNTRITTDPSSRLLEVVNQIEIVIGVIKDGHSLLNDMKENGPKIRDFLSKEEKKIPASIYGGIGILALVWLIIRRERVR